MEDDKLIALLQHNPAQGLRQAVQQYRGFVASIVLRILRGHPEDIEECIADTFINLWKAIERLDFQKGALKGYLALCARNTAINRLKKISKESSIFMDGEEFFSEEDQIFQIELSEDAQHLHQAILCLREPTREIIIRRYFYFQSLHEIANHLNLTNVQVKNRLYQGKQRLKLLLTERGVTR